MKVDLTGYSNILPDIDDLLIVTEAVSFKKPRTFVYNTSGRYVSDLNPEVLLKAKAFQKNLSFAEARRTLPVLGTVVNFKGQADVINVEIGGAVVREFNIHKEDREEG